MGRLFLILCVIVAHASSSAYITQTPGGNRLLILFLDGLRHDYFDNLNENGGVNQMRIGGCHVPRVKPVFPSNCYANTHALFAGHDSLHFNDFDDTTELSYSHRDLIWFKAAASGKKVKLFHFPFCSSISEEGIECVLPAENHTLLNATLSTALKSLAEKASDLAVVYYDELDVKAHLESSREMMKSGLLNSVDDAVLDIVKYIKQHSEEGINFMIVSDHGMMDVHGFPVVDVHFLWKHVKNVVNLGAVAGVWPTDNSTETLTKSFDVSPRLFDIYSPKTMPGGKPWSSSELPPFILLAHPGYLLYVNYHENKNRDHFDPQNMPVRPKAGHGYLSSVSDMHTTFLAYGPAFYQGCDVKSVDNFYTYDVFPIIEKTLFSNSKPSAFSKASGFTTVISDTVFRNSQNPEATVITEETSGWEIKVVSSLIVAVLVVVLLFALATRRIRMLQQREGDRIRLVEDLSYAEFQFDHCPEDEKDERMRV